MKVNFVLLYGTPFLRYQLFDSFKKMSDFIVKKCIVNYTIFEKMEDKKEVEMIYRDNDIRYLENIISKALDYINEYCIDDESYVNLTKKEKCIFDVVNILKGCIDER